jgi:thymidylate synthase
MKQYLDLLKAIKETGDYKEPARENMPGTYSLFGYQFRHKLEDGFPLLTTKKVSFKNIVVELLWFLRGESNIKYLVDNNCNIWNEDAYNYYCKIHKNIIDSLPINDPFVILCKKTVSFEDFCNEIKNVKSKEYLKTYTKFYPDYHYGDTGEQYPKLWRSWGVKKVDQFKELLYGLRNNPTSRRHIITAWQPDTLNDMALNACHCMAQWNCRKLSDSERADFVIDNFLGKENAFAIQNPIDWESIEKQFGPIPKYYLDCQMYQRSADSVLGVPYNIASYALLTHLISKVCNMIPGDFIHTFGDVHIYEDHLESVKEQLKREPSVLPTLNINTEFWLTETGECGVGNLSIDGFLKSLENDNFLKCLLEEDIQLVNYNPQESIKANLSTGMKK